LLTAEPNRHLEHTIILSPYQSRRFPWQIRNGLSSFARCAFMEGFPSNSRAPHARQATLHTDMAYRNAGLIPTGGGFNDRPIGSPRKMGRLAYAITRRPNSLTSSTNPGLGNQSRHKKLHRYALNGSLAPSSTGPHLTRILCHLLLLYYIYYKKQ
jgi:hypothetical protein